MTGFDKLSASADSLFYFPAPSTFSLMPTQRSFRFARRLQRLAGGAFTLFVLLATASPGRAQNQPRIDSLQRVVATQADTTRAWTLTRLAWEYRPYDRAKALAMNQEALALAVTAGHVEQQGFCWMALGNVYNFHEEEGPALAAYQQAEPLLRRAAGRRVSFRLAQLHHNWGLLLRERLSDYAGAVPHLLLSMRAYEQMGRYGEQATSLNAIANCLYYEQRTAEAFAYYRQAETAAQRSGSLKEQLTVMNDFYSSYLTLYAKDPKPAYLRLAAEHMQQGIVLIRQHPQQVSPQFLPTFLTNLAEACTWNREFDRARRLLRESTTLATPLGSNNLLAHNYGILATRRRSRLDRTKATAAASSSPAPPTVSSSSQR